MPDTNQMLRHLDVRTKFNMIMFTTEHGSKRALRADFVYQVVEDSPMVLDENEEIPLSMVYYETERDSGYFRAQGSTEELTEMVNNHVHLEP